MNTISTIGSCACSVLLDMPLHSTPFKASKRLKRRRYYVVHPEKQKASSKKLSNANKDTTIQRVLESKQGMASVNPEKARTDNRQAVSKHRLSNPEKARTDTQQAVSKHRLSNPEKARNDTRQAVSEHRLADPEKARTNTRQAVSKHRLADPEKARTNTRQAVSKHRLANPQQARTDTQLAVSMYRRANPDKARTNTRQAVSKHRLANPQQARTDTQLAVSKYRRANPDKARTNTRQAVSKHRLANPQQARTDTQLAVSKYRRANPEKARTDTRQAVSQHRQTNLARAKIKSRLSMANHRRAKPDKARADSRFSMSKFRRSNPIKSRRLNRQWVSAHYCKNLKQSRALSRTSTAKNYMKQLNTSRLKSKSTSKAWYKRYATIIRSRRRYPLAEPSSNVVNRLMTCLQDKFYNSKSLLKEILKGLSELPQWNTKNSKAQKHSACKHAASRLVRVCLQTRREAVATILRIKKGVMESTLAGVNDFGDRCHTEAREPFFYEAGYTHDHLSYTTYSHGTPTVEEAVHPLPGPITVNAKGVCTFPNLKPTHKFYSPEQQKQGNIEKPTLYKPCSVRCRQLSTRDAQVIVGLRDLFDEDIEVLREGVNKVDNCPYEHSKKQEWHISHIPECEYLPKQRQGHPLVCHLVGSECESPLRILRNASVHFPLLCEFQRNIYTCISKFKQIAHIDLGIKRSDHALLLQACGVTLETMFQQTVDIRKPGADYAWCITEHTI